MKEPIIEIYNGEGSIIQYSSSTPPNEYQLLSSAQQGICLGAFMLANSTLLALSKYNTNRNWGILNFITPLNKAEEIKLSKSHNKFIKVYKFFDVELLVSESLSGISCLLTNIFDDQMKNNTALGSIIPEVTSSLSIFSSAFRIFTTIRGRILLHMIPEEEIELEQVNNLNLSELKSKSLSDLSSIKDNNSLKRSKSDSEIIKYKMVFPMKPKIQLNQKTNDMIIEMLEQGNSSIQCDPIYLGITNDETTVIQIEEDEITKL